MYLIQLSNISNSYTGEEREFIYTTATKIGLTNESVYKIERWVEECLKWQTEGDKLLDMEG